MKSYVKLSVNERIYYSGAEYRESIFLPSNVWEEIKNDFNYYIYICDLDGKYSEIKCKIETDENITEKQLEHYIHTNDDGEVLFHHVYKYLSTDKYNRYYLMEIQNEVQELSRYIAVTYEIHIDDKTVIDEFVKSSRRNIA